MKVQKRNNNMEDVSFDKVIHRLNNLCNMLPILEQIDPIIIAQKVCSQIYDGVSTSKLDELSAEICISNSTIHPEFGILASRIIISNNHKCTSPSFSETIQLLYNNTDIHGLESPLVSQDTYECTMANKDKLNSYIKYSRDFNFDYFGFKTLEKLYLLTKNDQIIERIQHMFMRVSIGIHTNNIKNIS